MGDNYPPGVTEQDINRSVDGCTKEHRPVKDRSSLSGYSCGDCGVAVWED